jgi:hypothetical protein
MEIRKKRTDAQIEAQLKQIKDGFVQHFGAMDNELIAQQLQSEIIERQKKFVKEFFEGWQVPDMKTAIKFFPHAKSAAPVKKQQQKAKI